MDAQRDAPECRCWFAPSRSAEPIPGAELADYDRLRLVLRERGELFGWGLGPTWVGSGKSREVAFEFEPEDGSGPWLFPLSEVLDVENAGAAPTMDNLRQALQELLDDPTALNEDVFLLGVLPGHAALEVQVRLLQRTCRPAGEWKVGTAEAHP